MIKSLDSKVSDILANPSSSSAFIIADAKDADMAFGAAAPGPSSIPKASEDASDWKTLEDFRKQIREIVRQGIVDIMLMSASNVEALAIEERIFEESSVTPAARANDTSDIWAVRGGRYPRQASRSFRTATLDHIMYGCIDPKPNQKIVGADLGLYSITFTNNLDEEHNALREFQEFRIEAERKGFRYFLEVFNPNVEPGISDAEIPSFVNDHIVRSLAGVTKRGRPLFLKVAYNGPKALTELASYDPQLIVGILGGSAGTTYDAFRLISDAQKYGARVALFGRKINLSEHPLTFIEMLRRIVDHEINAEEAVRAYHGALEKLGIKPLRALSDDMKLTGTMMRYR
jgi:hypothetical protein